MLASMHSASMQLMTNSSYRRPSGPSRFSRYHPVPPCLLTSTAVIMQSTSKSMVMIDDGDDSEIQYMGSRPGPWRGVLLHFEDPEKDIGDRREQTMRPTAKDDKILVGRRPPSEAGLDVEDGKAMFRCPVVSRRHAEIELGKNGVVTIADLGSHHGTFVGSLKLQELKAHPLHSGDIVTFGKTVARNGECVHPVTVRVEILPSHLPPLPSPIKLASGRYGLSVTDDDDDDGDSSMSMSSSSFSSDHDSDIEEIPPSRQNSFKSLFSNLDAITAFTTSFPLPPLAPKESEPEPAIIGAWPARDESPLLEMFSDSDAASLDTSIPLRPTSPILLPCVPVAPVTPVLMRLEDIEDKVDELEGMLGIVTTLVEQVEGISGLDIPDMQAQIEALQDKDKDCEALRNIEREREEQKLKKATEEMEASKEELSEIISKARTALVGIEMAKAALAAPTPSSPSLKRKRDDVDDEEEKTAKKEKLEIAQPRRKHMRTVGRVVLRTVATVGVGAVAAWGALAFS
ncbi:SMAD/FHA domain-containing protein [Hymenopellis radicata]|nr:SMAD/FHA domain-containing protein [Hymenopellis radicata]